MERVATVSVTNSTRSSLLRNRANVPSGIFTPGIHQSDPGFSIMPRQTDPPMHFWCAGGLITRMHTPCSYNIIGSRGLMPAGVRREAIHFSAASSGSDAGSLEHTSNALAISYSDSVHFFNAPRHEFLILSRYS